MCRHKEKKEKLLYQRIKLLLKPLYAPFVIASKRYGFGEQREKPQLCAIAL